MALARSFSHLSFIYSAALKAVKVQSGVSMAPLTLVIVTSELAAAIAFDRS